MSALVDRLRRNPRQVLLAGAAALALALGGGTIAAAVSADSAPHEPAPEVLRASDAGGLQDPVASTLDAVPADAVALHVDIPAIGVSSDLEPLAIDQKGELATPVDYEKAGSFSNGVVPGRVGPAIIAGHVDSRIGPAVFERLEDLRLGDQIAVTMSTGQVVTFEMTDSIVSDKAAFPTSDVYGNVPEPQLRVITCGGPWDRTTRHYTANLIVYADLVSVT